MPRWPAAAARCKRTTRNYQITSYIKLKQKLLGTARGKFTSASLGVDTAMFKGGREIVQMMGQRVREVLLCLTRDSHATQPPTFDTYQRVCTFLQATRDGLNQRERDGVWSHFLRPHFESRVIIMTLGRSTTCII